MPVGERENHRFAPLHFALGFGCGPYGADGHVSGDGLSFVFEQRKEYNKKTRVIKTTSENVPEMTSNAMHTGIDRAR